MVIEIMICPSLINENIVNAGKLQWCKMIKMFWGALLQENNQHCGGMMWSNVKPILLLLYHRNLPSITII